MMGVGIRSCLVGVVTADDQQGFVAVPVMI